MSQFPTTPPYYYQEQPQPQPPRHSGIGIASFVIALLCGVASFVTIGIAGVMETSQPGGMDPESPATVLVGLAIIACGMGFALGLVLGIVGLCLPNTNRLFAGLGVGFNVVAMLGLGMLMLIGLVAG